MAFLLSILIPTLPERESQFEKLRSEIESQVNEGYESEVEILKDDRIARNKGGPTIAAKRNDLYQRASGLFSVQIDDDDEISERYIKTIVETIRGNPDQDCIEHLIRVKCRGKRDALANVSRKNRGWNHKSSGYYQYQQPIYYKVPIKTDICQKCKMDESKIWQEDADFARKLKKHVRKSLRIEKELYIYHTPQNVNINERY